MLDTPRRLRPLAPARWWWLPLIGVLAALVVATAGLLLERMRFGGSIDETRARVERDVREHLARQVWVLTTLAQRVAAEPDIVSALEQTGARTEAPFLSIERVVGPGAPSDLAVTVHAVDGTAVAWRGRPTAVAPGRVHAPAATFVVRRPTGLRLVHVVEVEDARGATVGAVTTERLVTAFEPVSARAHSGTRLETSLVPVSLQPGAAATVPDASASAFAVTGEDGQPLLTATISTADLERARRDFREHVIGLAASVLALTLVAMAWAAFAATPWRTRRAAVAVAAVLAARALLWWGLPASWRPAGTLGQAPPSSWVIAALLRSPVDLLLTAVTALGLVAIAFATVERWRLSRHSRRRTVSVPAAWTSFVALQAVAGVLSTLAILAFEYLLRVSVLARAFGSLDLSFVPWDPARATLFAGMAVLHAAAAWTATLLLRAGLAGWRTVPAGPLLGVATFLSWLAPGAALLVGLEGATDVSRAAVLLVLLLAAATAWRLRRGLAFYRHGSQGTRLTLLAAAVVVPTIALQPSLTYVTERARERAISTRFAAQAMDHPAELQVVLSESLKQIDAMPELTGLVAALPQHPGMLDTETAFSVWQQTSLARSRLTSAIELYGRAGGLVSRFALNFPEYGSPNQHWQNDSCRWGEVFGEAAPFGAEERRMLHAERAICGSDGRPQGAIVVHVMLDYGALPFLSTQSPYFEFFRAPQATTLHDVMPGGDVSLVVYGWGRTPIYTSTGRAWPIDTALFERLYHTREPFWTEVTEGDRTDKVFFANDRYGIYGVGYTRPSWFDHFVHLAELGAIGAAVFLALYAAGSIAARLARPRSAPILLLAREVRSSFSRKLFLAFVAAALLPVLVLAVGIRAYVASRLRAEIEAEAASTAAVAQRVIQETLATERRDEVTPTALNDDVMVWISRIIDQDVNIFVGTQIAATSERDLFASGLLPSRVPDDVYRAIVLQRLPSFVTEDQIADLRYLMAAAPIRTGDTDAILTVPLALQQREIEREIDDLDRGVLLGVVVFIALGAGVGYWLAQRIADPVARLTRASRRIASGELSARVFVRTADELQRLVESFNSMAHELERQRAQLEHTNRLEAWAEMARQVAHDIKNPLTPIQLSAEHLQRVHRDRGQPLSPVMEQCVDTILAQVRLLRLISSEFSNFATTPTVRPEPTDLAALLREIVAPYLTGLNGRVTVHTEVPERLPVIAVDQLLIGRAVTNVIENALQAMPSGGDLHVTAHVAGGEIVIAVRDTGVGMDPTDTARAFDPSFSTKTTGTGLGLPIAKRNVELNGGRVSVESEVQRGTTVTFRLPVA